MYSTKNILKKKFFWVTLIYIYTYMYSLKVKKFNIYTYIYICIYESFTGIRNQEYVKNMNDRAHGLGPHRGAVLTHVSSDLIYGQKSKSIGFSF